MEDRVRRAEFDPDQLESLMVTAFELLGKPEAQAQELARSILGAAERPHSGDPGPPDRDPTRNRV
jgi:LDH2 family malate/lactate/ureidoglycolate dehydrogenase